MEMDVCEEYKQWAIENIKSEISSQRHNFIDGQFISLHQVIVDHINWGKFKVVLILSINGSIHNTEPAYINYIAPTGGKKHTWQFNKYCAAIKAITEKLIINFNN